MDKYWKYLVWLSPELQNSKSSKDVQGEIERLKRDNQMMIQEASKQEKKIIKG
jgi:hypothetical protein